MGFEIQNATLVECEGLIKIYRSQINEEDLTEEIKVAGWEITVEIQ